MARQARTNWQPGGGERSMDYDHEKVDEMTLALMYLVLHGDKWGTRAWIRI